MRQKSDSITSLFQRDLTFADVDAEDYQTLLIDLGEIAIRSGLAKDSFVPAILEREALYPTGLHSKVMGFAIPHTDAEHVLRPSVIVAKLRHPVPFREMGTLDRSVDADYVFLLLLRNNGLQIALLQGLMDLCSDVASAKALQKADMSQEIYRIVTSFLSCRTEQEG